jgi:phosphinothricin acetyltransferase
VIRAAADADLPAIAELYAHHVLTGTASFEVAAPDNAASISLHAAPGFRHAGLLPAVGRKFDRRLDTVLMQRALGPGASMPALAP